MATSDAIILGGKLPLFSNKNLRLVITEWNGKIDWVQQNERQDYDSMESYWMPFLQDRITSYNVCYTKLLRGWWEVAIGVLFLFKKTTKIAIALLFIQMVGTFMPLVFLTEVTFQSNNILLPTLEGQYIIKNLMIISAALVLGGLTDKSKYKTSTK